MKKLERVKPYKAKRPLSTINSIRAILEGLELFTLENHIDHQAEKLFCCNVHVANECLKELGISTNGKGMTPEYALASAYGEFMERLQNQTLFPIPMVLMSEYKKGSSEGVKRLVEENGVKFDFLYSSCERKSDLESMVEESSDILKHIFAEEQDEVLIKILKEELGYKELLTVPFYDVEREQARYLPIRLIELVCGTNGMCAGNTKAEAIIQGIAEVFERYAIRRIYLERLTPPTIPTSYFEGTEIYEKIRYFEEEREMGIVIKDCSLGMGLPVIGALIYDYNSYRYTFHTASDPSPITALERCFTEIYQGTESDVADKFNPINLSDDPLEHGDINDHTFLKNYYLNLKTGAGIWPASIFGTEESYPFEGFNHSRTMSDREDLDYMVELIRKNGFELYVRDNSFLGFPAFFVYIPGMSEVDNFRVGDTVAREELLNCSMTFNNLYNADEADIRRAVEVLNSSYSYLHTIGSTFRDLAVVNRNEELNSLDIDLFLVMMNSRVENYGKALQYINSYLNKIESADVYYYCIREFLKLKAENSTSEQIKESLSTIFGKKQVEEVIEDFAQREKVFQYYPFPSCFDCDNCKIKEDCSYIELIKVSKRLSERGREANIDQLSLKDIFS